MSNLPEGAFLTSINGRECTAVPRRSTFTINYNATAAARVTPASTLSAQVDQQPTSLATSTGSTHVADSLTSMLVAEDVSTSTLADATPKPAAPNSSDATAVSSRNAASSRHSSATASFSSSSSHSSTGSVTSATSLSANPSPLTLSSTTTISPLSTQTSHATSTLITTTTQQQPVQPNEESFSTTVSTSAAVVLEPTASRQQDTSTTGGFQAPSIEATQGQETSQTVSASASIPVEGLPPAESPAPASRPPTEPTPGTNLDSQNGKTSRGPAPILSDVASSSSRVGAAILPTKTTLEISASVATAVASNQATPIISSITDTEPSTTALDDPFRQNHPQDGKPVGEGPGSSGNSGSKPQDIAPAADGPSRPSSHGMSTAGIIGIAVSGVAALSLIALLLWLWRRRAGKKRGATLPSSFSTATRKGRGAGANGSGGGAVRTRTRIARLAAALGLHDVGSKSRSGARDSTGVNLNRGPSQFLETVVVPRRDSSTATRSVSNMRTVKDRMLAWWFRKAQDKGFDDSVPAKRGGPLTADMAEKNGTYDARPEFRPGLGISFDGSGLFDPFSDAQAIPSEALPAAQATKPFVAPSTTRPPRHSRSYSQKASVDHAPAASPHSRGRSLSARVRSSQYPPSSMVSRAQSIHRDSLQSVDSFVDRRNKFRSDPFDLELESRIMTSSTTAVPQMPRYTAASSTYSSHTRPGSLSSSRYTSGVSLGDWSEAGTANPFEAAQTVAAPGRECDSPTLAEVSRPDAKTWPPEGIDVERAGMVVGQAL